MWENRLIRYLVYGTSAVLCSEIVYHAYCYLRRVRAVAREAANASYTEIAEVIWTNELTQTCVGQHYQQQHATSSSSSSSSPSRSTLTTPRKTRRNGELYKVPVSVTPAACTNRYCASYNVGRLIAFVDNARQSIDLAMYTFTSYELSQAFQRALRRGVRIRIISDKEMVYSSGSQISELDRAGIPVRSPSTTMLMHHKFCIIDGPKRVCAVLTKAGKEFNANLVHGLLMTGSLNWTMQGFGGNWENIVITSNKTLVEKFEDEYERMWKAFETKLGPIV